MKIAYADNSPADGYLSHKEMDALMPTLAPTPENMQHMEVPPPPPSGEKKCMFFQVPSIMSWEQIILPPEAVDQSEAGKMNLFSSLDKNGDGMVDIAECKGPGGDIHGDAFQDMCKDSEGFCDGTIEMDDCVSGMEAGSMDAGTGPATCMLKDMNGDHMLDEFEMTNPMTYADDMGSEIQDPIYYRGRKLSVDRVNAMRRRL